MILPLVLQFCTAAALRVVSVQAVHSTSESHRVVAARSIAAPATPGSRTLKFLVVPVRFAEQDSTFSADSLAKVFDGDVPTISVRKFMQEQSRGLIDVAFRVLPWMLSAVSRDSMGNAYAQRSTANEKVLREVFPYAQSLGVNWADYDNDKDGLVDGLMLLYSGRAYQETLKETDPLRAVTVFPQALEPVTGSFIQRAIRLLETEGGNILLPGGIAHELSHTLGAPDLYDRNAGELGLDGGIGSWDMMCNGSRGKWWGTTTLDPRKPIGYSAFSRMSMGWVQPREIESNQEVRLKPGETARLWTDSLRSTEYLLLENRDRSGVDSVLPGPGLSVMRVRRERLVDDWTGLPNTVNSDSSDMGVEILEGSGEQRTRATPWSTPFLKDLFGTASDSLTDNGPISLKRNGKPSGAWIRNIRLEADDVVFQANPAPLRGYGLEVGGKGIGPFSVGYSEMSILVPVTIPTAGRIVAITSVLPQQGKTICAGVWDSFPRPGHVEPVTSVCDSGGFSLDFQRFHHDLSKPISVDAGQVIWIGQSFSGGSGSSSCAGTPVDPDVDTTWVSLPDGSRGLIKLRPALGILVQTDSGSGGTSSLQVARRDVRIRWSANRVRVDGALPGETISIVLRDVRGRILWNGSVACDGVGAGAAELQGTVSGLSIQEAKGSFGIRSQVLSGF